MPTAEPPDTIELTFDRTLLTIGDDTDIRQGLSAAARSGDHLWLACDEGCRVERLSSGAGGRTFASHRTFPLDQLLSLPGTPDEEADIEGLDVDDGWLWLVGSHSLKRKKPKAADSASEAARKLATMTRDGNRHLLARIPIAPDGLVRLDGSRRAAALPATPRSSALLDAIASGDAGRSDPHLAPFVALPGKENGFDVEGLAVRGMRAFLGLRGPVLREWCCILELELEAEGSRLRLRPLAGGLLYRKHFLKLNGLGVRDLLAVDDDLLILAGPSMGHDGPHEIWRWQHGTMAGSRGATTQPSRLLTLPQREGADRAEGLAHFDDAGGRRLLVVFDTPSADRLSGASSVVADLYALP